MPGETSNQGDERMFGHFSCKKCKSTWMSGFSYENTAQTCKKCKVSAFPFKLQKLRSKKSKNKASNTPHQGEGKVFGYFRCPKCKNEWESAHSWARCGQQCLRCNVNVYPYHQVPLKRGNGMKKTKPHIQALCEKCKKINADCSLLRN